MGVRRDDIVKKRSCLDFICEQLILLSILWTQRGSHTSLGTEPVHELV